MSWVLRSLLAGVAAAVLFIVALALPPDLWADSIPLRYWPQCSLAVFAAVFMIALLRNPAFKYARLAASLLHVLGVWNLLPGIHAGFESSFGKAWIEVNAGPGAAVNIALVLALVMLMRYQLRFDLEVAERRRPEQVAAEPVQELPKPAESGAPRGRKPIRQHPPDAVPRVPDHAGELVGGVVAIGLLGLLLWNHYRDDCSVTLTPPHLEIDDWQSLCDDRDSGPLTCRDALGTMQGYCTGSGRLSTAIGEWSVVDPAGHLIWSGQMTPTGPDRSWRFLSVVPGKYNEDEYSDGIHVRSTRWLVENGAIIWRNKKRVGVGGWRQTDKLMDGGFYAETETDHSARRHGSWFWLCKELRLEREYDHGRLTGSRLLQDDVVLYDLRDPAKDDRQILDLFLRCRDRVTGAAPLSVPEAAE